MAAVLAPHTAVEEGALFPAMATEFGGHVRDLLDEHRLVEGVLAESASGTPTDPADWDLVDDIRAQVGTGLPVSSGASPR